MPEPPSSGYAPVQGGRLFYESAGEGHPVLLLHAGIADRRMWERQFERFAGRYRVVRYDVRGFGRSGPATVPYSDADDLAELLAHLDIDRVSLVGLSNGGRIALDFAVTRPGMVEALVPVASTVAGYELSDDPEERAAFDQNEQETKEACELARTVGLDAGIERMIEIWAPAVPSDQRPLLASMMRENAPRVFDQVPDFSIGPDPPTAGQLRHLTVPTLVVEAELDQPAIHYLTDAIATAIPGALRTTIAGADHLANLSRPDEFDRVVLDFLE